MLRRIARWLTPALALFALAAPAAAATSATSAAQPTVTRVAVAAHSPVTANVVRPQCIFASTATTQCGPPCYGSTCVGKDPQALGCSSDGQDLETVSAIGGGASITLRYSAWCGANWVRLDGPSYWPPAYWVETADGQKEATTGSWTMMVDGTQLARGAICSYNYSSCDPNYTRWH